MSQDSKRQVRTINVRRWLTAGTAITTLALVPPVAATIISENHAGTITQQTNAPAISGLLHLAASEGGEGGESGESSEGGEAGVSNTASDDVAYLTGLGLVEGEVRAAVALFYAGEAELAAAYLYRPGEEVYGQLEPGLKARGEKGLAATLEELKTAVDETGSTDHLKKAYAAFEVAALNAGKLTKSGDKDHAMAIVGLAKAAAHEYGDAYADGELENATEYHHSWGFMQTARREAEALKMSSDKTVSDAGASILQQLDIAAVAWPNLKASEKQPIDLSVLYGVAARIEIAALKIK